MLLIKYKLLQYFVTNLIEECSTGFHGTKKKVYLFNLNLVTRMLDQSRDDLLEAFCLSGTKVNGSSYLEPIPDSWIIEGSVDFRATSEVNRATKAK